MNLRNVLSVYAKMRQFTDDESALLKTLQGLNDTERELLVESLSPGKKPSKKSAAKEREYDHCLRCGTTKRDSSHKDQSSPDYHEFQSSKDIDFCERCKGATEVHPIHHNREFGGYHPFQSSRKSAASKPSTKSARASGMAAQLSSRRQAKQGDPDPLSSKRCAKPGCHWLEDDLIHQGDGGYAGYHPFVPAASTAANPSSPNDEDERSTVNSATA